MKNDAINNGSKVAKLPFSHFGSLMQSYSYYLDDVSVCSPFRFDHQHHRRYVTRDVQEFQPRFPSKSNYGKDT